MFSNNVFYIYITFKRCIFLISFLFTILVHPHITPVYSFGSRDTITFKVTCFLQNFYYLLFRNFVKINIFLMLVMGYVKPCQAKYTFSPLVIGFSHTIWKYECHNLRFDLL